MDIHVETISVDATVDGVPLDVEGAVIRLAVNEIPSIELMCAPTKGSGTPLKPVVVKPSISDFSSLYNRLSSAAEGLSRTGDVSVRLREDGGKMWERLNLRGWILSGVGMSSVSAVSAPHLSVILQHPICKLTKVGSVYETAKDMLSKKVDQATYGMTGFVSIMEAVHECVASAEYYPAPDPVVVQYRQALTQNEFKPSTYLMDKTTLFLDPYLKGLQPRMSCAEAELALPREGGTSIWDSLVNASGTLLTSIVQDQTNNFTTKRLVLAPMEPWSAPELTLQESECASTDLPGADSFRIIGVMARKPGIQGGQLHEGMVYAGQYNKKDAGVGEAAYIPKQVDPSSSDGRILKVSAPTALVMAQAKDAPTGRKLRSSTQDGMGDYAQNYDEAMKMYCKAVYELTARSRCVARANMRFSFTDASGSKLLLPGNSCRFESEGKTIYWGYIQGVTHSMSTQGGCSTVVDMSYVRGTPDYMINGKSAIPLGSRNWAYN